MNLGEWILFIGFVWPFLYGMVWGPVKFYFFTPDHKKWLSYRMIASMEKDIYGTKFYHIGGSHNPEVEVPEPKSVRTKPPTSKGAATPPIRTVYTGEVRSCGPSNQACGALKYRRFTEHEVQYVCRKCDRIISERPRARHE